jgi:hypothetical protein
MTTWQNALRSVLFPLLSDETLEKLREALNTDDPELIQEEFVEYDLNSPTPLSNAPPSGACLIAWPLWKQKGLKTWMQADIECNRVYKANEAALDKVIQFWDGESSEEAFAAVLAEVRQEIKRRKEM